MSPADAGTQPAYSLPSVLHMVEQRVALTPGAVAIRAAADCLTYQQLDQRANQLAHYLRSVGVGVGTVVGLCLERSPDLVVAALAVFKARGAYLPLDLATPMERLAGMLEDARAPVVITRAGFLESPSRSAQRVVTLDAEAAAISHFPPTPFSDKPTAEDLAYVIYTSGSTGTPKGVQVGHDNLLNLVNWHGHAFRVTAADRASQLASPGFDAAVWEIWPYLAAGASLHLVNDEVRGQPEKLRDWLVRERITISFVPTPVAEQMTKLPWLPETALRFLLTGADTLHHYPSANLPFALINNYGPTECTVVTTSAPVRPGAAGDGLPPIGWPIANAEVYVLDGDQKPVAPGKIGELYIGGAGVARGYVNRPALTSERFVADPFAKVSGARLYRTGDLGCYEPDGQIAFHGRIDDYVKIRGYRIDPGEVVNVLGRHPAVRASAVLAREDGGTGKRLVAYVVAAANSSLKDSGLREFLRQYLPEYMLPSVFVKVESLPVAANGKLDRSALAAPDDGNIIRDEVFVAPRSATERQVAALLAPLLHIDKVGANDNFFLLGGNSLLGTQVINRVSEVFGVDLTLLGLFDHPTVAGIAQEIENLLAAENSRRPTAIVPPWAKTGT
ncbi:MAG: amino acid adenylation domain-containing protein [Candidatus Sulfotelmatobacter sp.]